MRDFVEICSCLNAYDSCLLCSIRSFAELANALSPPCLAKTAFRYSLQPPYSLRPLIQRLHHLLWHRSLFQIPQILLYMLRTTCPNDHRIPILPLQQTTTCRPPQCTLGLGQSMFLRYRSQDIENVERGVILYVFPCHLVGSKREPGPRSLSSR